MKKLNHAARKRSAHAAREFIRGAGTGALMRANRILRTSLKAALAAGVLGVLVPGMAVPLVVGIAGVSCGALTYAGFQMAAAGLHRLVNKGIPEAPGHNRPAQRLGRKVLAATAVTAALGVEVTASFGVAAASYIASQRILRSLPLQQHNPKLQRPDYLREAKMRGPQPA